MTTPPARPILRWGFALAAAAELEVDSTPMEGFAPEKIDEILELREKGLRSVLLLPLGYRQGRRRLAPSDEKGPQAP